MRSTVWLLIPALAAIAGCDHVKQKIAEFKEPAGSVPSSRAVAHDLAAADFEAFTARKGKLVVVDFHATWCGPCKVLAPILEKVAAEHQGLVIVGKIDVDQAKELAAREGIEGIPDVRLYRDGRRVDQFVGVPPESALREMFTRHTQGLVLAEETSGDTEATDAAESRTAIQPMKKDWLPSGVERR